MSEVGSSTPCTYLPRLNQRSGVRSWFYFNHLVSQKANHCYLDLVCFSQSQLAWECERDKNTFAIDLNVLDSAPLNSSASDARTDSESR